MATITIMSESRADGPAIFRAEGNGHATCGETAGQALDALAAELDGFAETTLVLVHANRPDRHFGEAARRRLGELMARWRGVRDGGMLLPAADQVELEALVDAETAAAAARTAELFDRTPA